MKNNGLKNAKAITLIAMVVTIIVLLILAGVSIAVLTGENGIINRTTEAKTTSEIAKVEEIANLELANSLIGARAGLPGESEKEIGDIVQYLLDKHEIEAGGTTGLTTITGISVGETSGLKLKIGSANAVEKIATFSSSDPSQDYYVQIQGKTYPIAKTNGRIKITPTEIHLGTNPTGEITNVSSNNDSIATVAQKEGTKNKIILTGVSKGTATITVEYTSTIKTSFDVQVKGNVSVTTGSEDSNIGTVTPTMTNATYAEGDQIPLTASVTDSNYNFAGWYERKGTNAEGESPISTALSYEYTVPSDTTAVTLTAKFVEKPSTMPPSDSGVGCFIKKGSEYAIVFADRLAQSNQPASWSSTNTSSFTFPTVTESQFKTYIKGENYTDPSGKWGTHPLIEIVNSSGEDRFMALALDDYPTTAATSSWYSAAYGQMENPPTQTSKGFLTGKTNTETMLKKGIANGYGTLGNTDVWYKLMDGWTPTMKTSWTANGYGATSSSDAWGAVKNGWFIPSFEEWVAFGVALNGNKFQSSIYPSLGLSDYYWSSSQYGANYAWYAYFSYGCMFNGDVGGNIYVRLATTF